MAALGVDSSAGRWYVAILQSHGSIIFSDLATPFSHHVSCLQLHALKVVPHHPL
jgi:hypothetical protein